MAISLKLPTVSKKQKTTFLLSSETLATLKQYVEAARADAPHCDESIIVETILDHHFRRDKDFQKWLKSQATAMSDAQRSRPAATQVNT